MFLIRYLHFWVQVMWSDIHFIFKSICLECLGALWAQRGHDHFQRGSEDKPVDHCLFYNSFYGYKFFFVSVHLFVFHLVIIVLKIIIFIFIQFWIWFSYASWSVYVKIFLSCILFVKLTIWICTKIFTTNTICDNTQYIYTFDFSFIICYKLKCFYYLL